MRWKIYILYIVIILAVIAAAFFLLFSVFNKSTENPTPDKLISVSVGGIKLNSDGQTVIFTDSFKPEILIDNKDGITLSVDQSLNVLNDNFYGVTLLDGDSLRYVPNFSLTPGAHKLDLNWNEESKKEFDIIIAYHETFSTPFESNHTWIVPSWSPESWFSVVEGKLQIIPDTETSNSSVAFRYNLSNNFNVDFELTPLGKNVDAVPYIINSVRNEFVLGSNNNERNVLFHSDPAGRKLIEGSTFLWEKDTRYQIRITRKNDIVNLFVHPLSNGNVDPSLSDSSFQKLIEYPDPITDMDHPYTFGVSAWNNTDGLLIDDIYITSQ